MWMIYSDCDINIVIMSVSLKAIYDFASSHDHNLSKYTHLGLYTIL